MWITESNDADNVKPSRFSLYRKKDKRNALNSVAARISVRGEHFRWSASWGSGCGAHPPARPASENISGYRCLPPTPLLGRPPKVFHLKRKPGGAAIHM